MVWLTGKLIYVIELEYAYPEEQAFYFMFLLCEICLESDEVIQEHFTKIAHSQKIPSNSLSTPNHTHITEEIFMGQSYKKDIAATLTALYTIHKF